MSARAPEAIQRLWNDVHAAIPKAKLGGIVGDAAHSFGYHLSRNQLGGGDYSVQLAKDRKGKADCASALDVTLPADLMQTCTRRLHAAAVNRDPRVAALREFCGTLDGRRTYPWDLSTNTSEGVGSWDDSHLWHIHLSFYRQYADDYTALAPIADVLAGVTTRKDPLMGDKLSKEVHAEISGIVDRRLDQHVDPLVKQLKAVQKELAAVRAAQAKTAGK